LVVVVEGTSDRRWKGESIENSSWTASPVTGTKGAQ
jgi:hypothetical protein